MNIKLKLFLYAILISASRLSFAVGPIQTSEYILPETIGDDWESYKSDIEVLDSIYQSYPWKLNIDEVWFDSLQIPSSQFSRQEYILDSEYQMDHGIGYGAHLNISDSRQYIFYSNWQPNVPANGNGYAVTLDDGVPTSVVAKKIPGSTRTHILKNSDGTKTVIMTGIDEGELSIGEDGTAPSYEFNLQTMLFSEMPIQDIAAHHSIVFDFEQDGDDDIMATTWGDNLGVIFKNNSGSVEIIEVKMPMGCCGYRLGYSMNAPFYENNKLSVVIGDAYLPSYPDLNIADDHNFIAHFDPSMSNEPESYTQLPLPYFDREQYLEIPTRFTDGQHRSHDVASVVFDIDSDGDNDILISTMLWNDDFPFGNLQILINNDGEYTDETDTRLYNWLIGGAGYHQVDIADVNQDGFPDLLLSDHGDVWFNKMFRGDIPNLNTSVGAGSKILLNDGDGHFVTVAHQNISKPFSYQASHIPSMTESGLLRWTSINSRTDVTPNTVAVEVVTVERALSTGPNGVNPSDFGVPWFNEFYYLLHNEQARKSVIDNEYNSGLDHYLSIGQFQSLEINAHRADTDSDGVRDYLDALPNDPTNDSDNDGVANNADLYPLNSLYSADSDGDGMADAWELLYGLDPNDPSDASSDVDNDGAVALQEFIEGTIPSGSLDIDGNENYDALTDGLLLLRGMFGLDGSALVTGTIASNATYTESVDIESRIETLGDLADIDGNGNVDALTDGLLILRYLFGLQGDTLINGVIASDATRKTAEEIEAHLASLMPSF